MAIGTCGSRVRLSSVLLSALLALSGLTASCGGGGGGGGGQLGESGPAPPGDVALSSAAGEVRVTWTPLPGVDGYRLYWSTTPGVVPGQDPMIEVTAPPLVVGPLPAGTPLFARISSVNSSGEGSPGAELSVTVNATDEERYFPSWWQAVPSTVITMNYDPGKSSGQNGADLSGLIQSLLPGDKLEVGDGTYTIDSFFGIELHGTQQAPIWITAAEGATPTITRSNNNQNTVNIGSGGGASFLCLRGFEITGGDIAMRIYDAHDVWIDQCDIHHCAQNAIAANSNDVDKLTFTRNEVHDTAGSGEGFYIGGNYGDPIASNCVIALNHVYNCGGVQGDGIEVKQGSWGNWIAENIVHDTNYPCILTGGTAGMPFNLVEKNVCWNSNDYTMQIQGEAIVRNNVIFGGQFAFYSGNHQGEARELTVVHNTIVNTGDAAVLSSWNGKPGMTFANNACYSQSGAAIIIDGTNGVQVAGNVAVGAVYGASSGYSVGVGLSDFTNVAWDASARDVGPSPSSALLGAASAPHAELEDLYGTVRTAPHEAGAVDSP